MEVGTLYLPASRLEILATDPSNELDFSPSRPFIDASPFQAGDGGGGGENRAAAPPRRHPGRRGRHDLGAVVPLSEGHDSLGSSLAGPGRRVHRSL